MSGIIQILIKLHTSGRRIILRKHFFSSCSVKCQSSKTGKPQDGHTFHTSLLKHLVMKIKATGPLTVAEYMREVLTNPIKGYYMHHDMLGEHGDFVTSPEISQIFGEVFCQFSHLLNNCEISVHLVEVSPKLSDIQAINLTGKSIEKKHNEVLPVYKKGLTKHGIPVFWYQNVEDVPPGYAFYLAHEFFDALPIHKFQKTEEGWREILIDIDPIVPEKLRFVLGTSSSLVAKSFIQDDEERDHVEVCPSAAVIIRKLAHQVKNYGGAALIADYGHFGEKTDTFRGFHRHQLHDVLITPGMADLTADVDFKFLKRMIGSAVTTLGPISQREFLKNMGIDFRLKVLLEHAEDTAIQQQLKLGYDILMYPDKMGERFKFFSVFPHSRFAKKQQDPNGKSEPVAGFSELVMQ